MGERKWKALQLERQEADSSCEVWAPNKRSQVRPPQGVMELDLCWEESRQKCKR